jgi:hypothetical protein
MNTSDRTLFEASLGPNPKRTHDDPDMVEIIPGVWMHKERLATEMGRSWAETLTEDHQRRLNMPRTTIEPNILQTTIKIRSVGPVMSVQTDAQKLIIAVADAVGKLTGHRLWADPLGGAPNAPTPIVESASRILKHKLSQELREFLSILKEDLIYEVYVDVSGEVKRSKDGKRTFQQQLREKRLKRTAEKYKSHPGTESRFPTAGHLKVALKEALKTISAQKPGKKVTESDIIRFFSNHPNYPKCGSEGTLRYWLRKHNLPKWSELRDVLQAEI